MVFAANSTLGGTAISVANGAILTMMAGSSAGGTSGNATLAGTTGGATFSLEDSAIGTFTLKQNSFFSGAALTLGGDMLDFDISNLGTDEILDSGPGKASVSGVNIINMNTLTPTLTPSTYTLISIPSGGLIGTFEFSNSQTSELLGSYRLTLNNTSTAETITVVAVPEPATMGLVAMGLFGLLRTRRR
jgi:PEP-CTERM motif